MPSTLKLSNLPAMRWLNEQIVGKRLNSPLGWVLAAVIGLSMAYLAIEVNQKLPIIICAGLFGILVLLVCLKNTYLGFYIVIIVSCFISIPERINLRIPIGVMIEGLSYVVFAAMMAHQYRKREKVGAFWRSPISIILIITYVYYFVELGNPEMLSAYGWSMWVRKQCSFLIFYYMAYIVLNDLSKIRFFLYFWVGITTFIALWGIKQQWFGFFPFEQYWINADDQRVALFFQNGFMRKFSILSDPAGFGICMAAMGTMILIFAIRTESKKTRNWLLFAAITTLVSCSYSGTRTSNLMIAAGIAAYALFTLNERKTFVLIAAVVLVGLFLVFGPMRNSPIVFRMTTTLDAKKDASSQVRDINRHRVQPYLQAHPLGGGINTCGSEGLAYNPTHYMAEFQPDGGYMKTYAEQGYIGLAIHMIFYLIALTVGVNGFYDAVNAEIKNMYICITIFLFTILVAEIGQMANGGYPYSYFYYPVLAILYRLKFYDSPAKATAHNTNLVKTQK